MNIKPNLKRVEVTFRNSVDVSEFDGKCFNQINTYGLELTDLNLIHCASIHLQSRFKNDISRRFRATLDVIEPSLLSDSHYNMFYFNEIEDSELQTQSSECIGIGFGIALFQKLLNVNFNSIHRIHPSGRSKRCDYKILKNGEEYYLETKGRKDGIEVAALEIEEQKLSIGNPYSPKYGCITHIPRNDDPVNIVVVDPESYGGRITLGENLINLLIYYSKCIQLSGNARLAKELNKIIDIYETNPERILEIDNKKIELPNAETLQTQYAIKHDGKSFIRFDKEFGLFHKLENNLVVTYGIDKELIEIIINLNFKKLVEYNYENKSEDLSISINNDGTILALLSEDALRLL